MILTCMTNEAQRAEGCSFETMRLRLNTCDYKRVNVFPSSLLHGPSLPIVLALALVGHLVELTQLANSEESCSAI